MNHQFKIGPSRTNSKVSYFYFSVFILPLVVLSTYIVVLVQRICLDMSSALCMSRLTGGSVCFAYRGNKYWLTLLLFAALGSRVFSATHTLSLPSGLGSLRFTSLEFVNNLFSQVQSPRRSDGSNMCFVYTLVCFSFFFAHYAACLLSNHYPL